MTRGNQREMARAKNQKKQQELKKGQSDDGLTPLQRKERDAQRLREKQAQKEAQKATEAGGSGGQSSSKAKP